MPENRGKAVAGIILLVLLLIPSAFLARNFRHMPQLGIHHDDSIYWVSARSLASGQGYRIASLPGAPYQTKYPPVYPALLALIWRVNPEFPDNLPLAALFAWLCLPPYLLLIRKLLGSYGLSWWLGWLLVGLIALNAMTVMLSLTLMPEVIFSIALIVVILWAERLGEMNPANPGGAFAAGTGLLAGIAYLIRSAALPLLITVPLCLWMQKRKRAALLFISGMVPPVLGWMIWGRAHQSNGIDPVTLYYTNYLGFQLAYVHWSDLPRLVWTNVDAYCNAVGQLLLFNPSDGVWPRQLARLTAFAAIVGSVRLVQRTRKFQLAAYGVGLTLMLLVWHYPPGARFVYALYPLFLAGLAMELRHVYEIVRLTWRKRAAGDRIAAGIFASILAVYVASFFWFTAMGVVSIVPGILDERAEIAASRVVTYQWIRDNTPPSANFLAYDDVLLHLYTGRHAVSRPIPPDLLFHDDQPGIDLYIASTPEFVRQCGLDWVLFTTADYSRDLHGARMERLRQVLKTSEMLELKYLGPDAAIYAVKR